MPTRSRLFHLSGYLALALAILVLVLVTAQMGH